MMIMQDLSALKVPVTFIPSMRFRYRVLFTEEYLTSFRLILMMSPTFMQSMRLLIDFFDFPMFLFTFVLINQLNNYANLINVY